jgi:hypothetical protein
VYHLLKKATNYEQRSGGLPAFFGGVGGQVKAHSNGQSIMFHPLQGIAILLSL